MKVVIFGASGFCGRILTRAMLAKGYEVTTVSRNPWRCKGVNALTWNGKTIGPWSLELDGADVVINLAGRSVNCRYNRANRQAIYDSRLESTRLIGKAIAACGKAPKLWLNASSATIYRHAEDRPMDEAGGELGDDFSPDVCKQWERTFFEAPVAGVRRVAMRSAIVFAPEPGGVWTPFSVLAKLLVAGPMAGGRQMVSWVHGEDFCRAIDWIIHHEDLEGVVNIASPNPLTNRDFLAGIRRALGAPFGIPSAKWMLKIAAVIHRTETELLLKSRWVVPGKLLASGFTFNYPDWAKAAQSIAKEEKGRRRQATNSIGIAAATIDTRTY